jgi:hypothetical protein
MDNMERRLEGRFMCAEVVHVTRLERDQIKTLEAVLEDISPLGACVQVEQAIPSGAEVVLAAGEKGLSGVVSYCVYRDYGYFVGIQFLDETPWSSSVFTPGHLTNLQAIAHRVLD